MSQIVVLVIDHARTAATTATAAATTATAAATATATHFFGRWHISNFLSGAHPAHGTAE